MWSRGPFVEKRFRFSTQSAPPPDRAADAVRRRGEDDDALGGPQGRCRRQRLLDEDVEHGAGDALGRDRLHQIGIHHEVAARGIQSQAVGFHSASVRALMMPRVCGVEGAGGGRSPTGPAPRRGHRVRRPSRPRPREPRPDVCRSPASPGRSPSGPPRRRWCRRRGRRASCRPACRSPAAASAARADRARCRPAAFGPGTARPMCSGIEPVDAARAGEDGALRQLGRGQPLLHARGERVDPAQARRLRAQPGGGPPGEQRLGAAEEVAAGLDFSGPGPAQSGRRSRRPRHRADRRPAHRSTGQSCASRSVVNRGRISRRREPSACWKPLPRRGRWGRNRLAAAHMDRQVLDGRRRRTAGSWDRAAFTSRNRMPSAS